MDLQAAMSACITRISALMEKRGLTRRALAKHLRKSSAAISQLLNGQRELRLEELYRIADWFGVPVSYFLDDDPARLDTLDIPALPSSQDSRHARTRSLEQAEVEIRLHERRRAIVDYLVSTELDYLAALEILAGKMLTERRHLEHALNAVIAEVKSFPAQSAIAADAGEVGGTRAPGSGRRAPLRKSNRRLAS